MFLVTMLCVEADDTPKKTLALAMATGRFQSCLCLSLLAHHVSDFSKICRQGRSRER